MLWLNTERDGRLQKPASVGNSRQHQPLVEDSFEDFDPQIEPLPILQQGPENRQPLVGEIEPADGLVWVAPPRQINELDRYLAEHIRTAVRSLASTNHRNDLAF